MSTPNEPENTQAKGSDGPVRGGVVPPWQRGTGNSRTTEVPQPDANRPPGPPPRGVVSSAGTAAASMSGQQAPVTKLDNPPSGRQTAGAAAAAATEKMTPGRVAVDEPTNPKNGAPAGATQKFVESPTRNIARTDLPGESLPNLDKIHHVDEVLEDKKAKEKKAQDRAAEARSAPIQVGGRPLRAGVQIRRIDPWATFKISAVLAVVGFFIWMIAVAVLYLVLDGMGVWDQVNSSFGTLVTADGSSSEGDVIGAGTVFGWALLLGAVNAILLTALATIGSYIYNLCADLIGGVEVTLADLD